jgi:hypothetical protein
VFVATVTSVRRVALAARYNIKITYWANTIEAFLAGLPCEFHDDTPVPWKDLFVFTCRGNSKSIKTGEYENLLNYV